MSLRSPAAYIIPEDAEQAARASFPKGHPLMRIADEFGLLYSNSQFSTLFSPTGQPALDPARLALITVFQFMEGLSDEQAVDAVRGHLAWKYALALPLHYSGFDSSVLSEFRTRLIDGGLEMQLLDTLLDRLKERGLLKARGRARTDSTHVLAAVRSVGRLVNCIETVRYALNALAQADPNWLGPLIEPEWVQRYSHRASDYRLPKGKEARGAMASLIGADGSRLLTAVYDAEAPANLRLLPQVQVLRKVWIQQFHAPTEDGTIRWREVGDLPPAGQLIISPYDIEARTGKKREHRWIGYKVHITETCDDDDDAPHLITHVETTTATATDEAALQPIHQALKERDLLPAEHLVDAGYVDGARLTESKEQYEVRLVGPMPDDNSWQTRAGKGFSPHCFAVDWDTQKVTCPAGKQSSSWTPIHTAWGKEAIHVHFVAATCRGCAVRTDCTKSARAGRGLTLRPKAEHLAMLAQRVEQQSIEFKEEYKRRAGVEGTLSRSIRVGGLRQSRYIGAAKTALQNILIAVGINLLRMVEWFEDHPMACTRISPFAALASRRRIISNVAVGASGL
jgi:transposase